MIGVGTWATQVEFKDIKVTQGNQILYSSDFSTGLQGWKTVRGKWEVSNGVLRQTGDEENTRALVGNPSWSNYTLTLQARKISGNEGFLILFGVPDQNTQSWWNIGGWGNTRHAIHAPGVVEQQVPGNIETGRWYDIKVELSGNTIRAYLDNQLIHTATQAPGTHTLMFSTNAPGKKKSIPQWGLDTSWPSLDNMIRGLAYMGKDRVDIVRVAFPIDTPLVNGRYVIVNRHSGKVLGVAGANKENGAAVEQMDYTRAAHQQWEVAPFVGPFGDQSYFTLRAVHSGKALDTADWSHAEGGKIQQWGEGEADPQHWFFEYAGRNNFYIRSRWNTKHLAPAGGSKSAGAAIVQTARMGTPQQQWRLVPVSGLNQSPLDFVAPQRPSGLKAAAKPLAISLQWTDNRDADLASYTVFRSTKPGGPYDTIARGVTGSNFTDRFTNREAKGQTKYYYVVCAVDRSLNQSTFSAEASVIPGRGSPLR